MRLLTLILWFLLSSNLFSQPTTDIFRIDSLPTEGVLLDKGWKFHAGDNPGFAEPDFDDSGWEGIDPTKNIIDLPQIPLNGQIFWLRNTFSAGSLPSMIMQLEQIGATQIFLNGKLIYTFGNLDKNRIKAITPSHKPLSCPIVNSGQYVLSVRYVCEPNIHYSVGFGNTCALFKLQFFTPENWHKLSKWKQYDRTLNIVVSSFFICLCLLFFTFYLFFPNRKINLYFAVYTFLSGIPYFCYGFFYDISEIAPIYWLHNFNIIFGVTGYICIQTALHNQFEQKKGIIFWFFVVLGLVSIVLSFFYYWGWQVYGVMVNFLGSFAIMLLGIKGRMQQKRGASIIATGGGFFFLFWIGFLTTVGVYEISPFLYALAQIAVPIAIAIFVGHDLAQTNTVLQQKLEENQKLFEEKQNILFTQNETLEKQVAERTHDLNLKNRELEIEAALEKIRSASLAMHHSNEIEHVVAIFFEKLKELGLVFDGGTGIHLFTEGAKDAVIWVYAPFQPPTKINLPYDAAAFVDNTIILDVWQAHNTGTPIFNKIYSFEEKNRYFNYVFNHNDYTIIPEEARNFILSVPNYTASFVAEKHSLIGANSWTGQCFSASDFEILKRVARVFEQAYVRFLDLQKAEAQARESEIELALERVRAKTMSMQKSSELREIVATMYEQLRQVGFTAGACSIVIMDELTGDTEWWIHGFGTPYPESYWNTYFEHPFYLAQLNHWKEGKKYAVMVCEGEDKKAYDDYVFNKTDFARIPIDTQNVMKSFEKITFSNAYMKYGALSWSTEPLDEAHANVLQRFAYVFEQSYTRFLDLQKAEAQAREAKIEVALEKIRASALAMDSSTDFHQVVKTLREQLLYLGQKEWEASVIQFYHTDKGYIESWQIQNIDSDTDSSQIGISRLYFDACRLTKRYLEEYLLPQDDYTIISVGEELEEWKDYLISLSPEVEERIRAAQNEIIYMHHSKFSAGALVMVSQTQPNEESKSLQKRAASVFDLAYTRFLDLQLKEHQAIILIEEKQKLEQTLVELRSTQTQLIQKEKLASLGELTAGIAHEIQNPLNFVNNFSELSVDLVKDLKDEIKRPDKDEAYIDELFDDLSQNQEKINLHGKRASNIVKSMLEHSRASTGERQLTDINALCDEYLRLSYHGMRAKNKDFNCDFKTDFGSNLPKINVIPQDIGRVLLNLINNAFYAVHQQQQLSKSLKLLESSDNNYTPSVTVSTEQFDNQIIISVKDNGNGIPDNIKPKIFQPFFTTKPTGEGTGLGLSLSYDIVTKGHGGSLEVDSTEGVGSMFTIRLSI